MNTAQVHGERRLRRGGRVSRCTVHASRVVVLDPLRQRYHVGVPASAQGLFLVVSDIEAARADLAERGADVSEVFHRTPGEAPVSGPDPARQSYASYATFSGPDGNSWLLQEVTTRLPGRVDANDTTFTSSTELASATRRGCARGAREAHRQARYGGLAGLVRGMHRR